MARNPNAQPDLSNMRPVDHVAPAAPASAPALPAYPPSPNPYLRSPLPAAQQLQPDTLRQFYQRGISQTRLVPIATAGQPTVNSTARGVSLTTIAEAASTPGAGAVPEIFVNVQTGTSYLVLLSDRDTAIEMTNNAGGTVTLPGGATSFAFVQTVSNVVGHTMADAVSVSITNTLGNSMILIGETSLPNSMSQPITVLDTNGNVWTPVAQTGSSTVMWYATNIKGGPNSVTLAQSGGGTMSYLALVIHEFSGFVPGGLDQHGIGAGSASITPTVSNTVAVAGFKGLLCQKIL
jgi:hypothetical protein